MNELLMLSFKSIKKYLHLTNQEFHNLMQLYS